MMWYLVKRRDFTFIDTCSDLRLLTVHRTLQLNKAVNDCMKYKISVKYLHGFNILYKNRVITNDVSDSYQ